MTKLFLLGVVFFGQLLWAGHEVGGGNAVVCKDKLPRLLDYYEAEVILPDLLLDLGGQGQELDRVHHVLQRWARLDRPRAERFLVEADKFFDNALFLEKMDLPDTHDYGYVPIDTSKCHIEQLAAQREVPVAGARPFLVKQELWDSLKMDDRAGLILHELLYWEARKLGHKNSINTRLFNSVLSSRRMETMSASEYFGEVEKLGFGDGPDPIPPPPVWVMDPINLPAAMEDRLYSASLKQYAHDPSGSVLTFGKMPGTAWLSVSSSGELTGTPSELDLGENRFDVRVCNAAALCASATVSVNVIHTHQPPVWVQDPIDFGLQSVGKFWLFDLKTKIQSSQNLKFKIITGPAWITLDDYGVLAGRPKEPGKYALRISATDELGFSTSVKGFGEVKSTAVISPHWQSDDILLPDAFEDSSYQEGLAKFVTNPDSQTLKFELVEGPSWISLSQQGKVFGVPSRKDIGSHHFSVKVTSESGLIAISDTARFSINVQKINHAPYWTVNPVTLPNATVGKTYSQSITPYAADIDGNVLFYMLKAGPPWMVISSTTGQLIGTPRDQDEGLVKATVVISDGNAESAVEVRLSVWPANESE